MKIRIAVPSKGRISEPAIRLLENAGVGLKDTINRKLFSKTQHPQIDVMFSRAADIPEFVADGAADLGITGYDLIVERGSEVEILEDLNYGRASLVLAAPEDSSIEKPEDIPDGAVIATEFPRITEDYVRKRNIGAEIVELTGSTEIAPFIGVADLITDLSSTGTTLRMNHLKVIDTLLESSVKLIANPESYRRKGQLIEELRTGIRGVIDAEGRRLVMLNIDRKNLDRVRALMPGMTGPTVSEVLSDNGVVAVHAVVDEKEVFNLVNRLKAVGARDILVVPIERIIP
ncbi:ATP phosphoribosyltransferase [Methanothermobacter sp. K4]|uniref:ATP phosphoribosyltransferase n=1 Tax=Methanothermobacter sp. K4 TaxID=2913262 RepID=UPI001EDB32C7|nr:ATP phosphoribosyltransferase [Methanothermobacter sp. K4]MCG2827861.1 ATP phosphoribosyltransferase [Methanothermobacter sp. K4]